MQISNRGEPGFCEHEHRIEFAASERHSFCGALPLTLFFAGIVTMLWAFFIAVNRSRVDAIGVGGLYFGAGSTPKAVRWHLLGATTMQLVAGIVTASIRPFTPLAFGTLVWIFGIGMMGLWTARYGEFEPTDEPVDSLDEGDGADEA